MKFNVCGGLDAPDWILAHMSTLSKISSVRIKVLAKHIINRMLDGVFDYEKVLKLSRDSSLGESEVKACIAVLDFFVANAAKFDVDDSTLSKELQQLGLPKEHSDALCTPYLDNKDSLQAKYLEQTLQIPALKIGGWQVQLGEAKNVVMRLTTAENMDQGDGKTNDLQLCLPAEKFHLLLHDGTSKHLDEPGIGRGSQLSLLVRTLYTDMIRYFFFLSSELKSARALLEEFT